MKRLYATIAVSLLAALAVLGCAGYGSMFGASWEVLIDGEKGLENFNRTGTGNWRAEGGAIVADNKSNPKETSSLLVTKKSYKDFEIYAEFWAADTTNSGIFIRCTDPNKIGSTSSYEVNIFDQRPDPSYGTGAIVNVASVNPMPKAGGRWNTYEIYAKGSLLIVKLNGVVTASVNDTQFASGPFALQYGSGAKGILGGPIKWRKVAVREL